MSVSETVRQLNPGVFDAMGSIRPGKPKQRTASALVKKSSKVKGRKGSVECIVTITTYRARLLDDDNHAAGCKPLRDAIASTLGINDADPRVKWEYAQVKSDGMQGTVVKIEYGSS